MSLMGLSKRPKPIGHQDLIAQGIRIQSSAYGRALTIIYGTNRFSGNLIWYGDFTAFTSFTPSASVGKGFGGGGNIAPSSSTTDYYAAFMWGLCEGPIGGINNVWVGNGKYSLATVGLSLFNGTRPTQSSWGYLTTNHPGEDLGYEGLAYLAVSSYYLGTSASLPNFSFEVAGILVVGNGNNDADPSVFLADFLTNPEYGVGLLPAQLDNGGTGGAPTGGSWLTYQEYIYAQGLFLSPILDSQQDAVDILNEWLQYTNVGAIWSEGVLKLIPYGDTTISGNQKTYTPDMTTIYSFTDDDFLYSDGQDPVEVTRQTPADAFNIVRVQYLDRANNYMPATVTASDQNSLLTYGPRPQSTYTANEICELATAQAVAQLLLQQQAFIRNLYTWKVDARYILVEPMDLVAITDAALGLEHYPVRVTQVQEDKSDDGLTLTITAQDLFVGIAQTPGYPSQALQGYQTGYDVSPGNPNAPLFVCAPPALTAGNLEVWMAVSGGPTWGGCYVYVSTDGNTYTQVGKMSGQTRMGVLLGSLPVSTDPDTVDTLDVNLTQSAGQLINGSQSDADLLLTLCAIDTGTAQELISYETALLIGTNEYGLSYLRRGAYGTPIGAHAAGVPFARLDDRVFKLTYSSLHLGQTIYVKLQGFNIYGQALQDLASLSPYIYTIVGPPLTGMPTGFSVQQYGGTVVFHWDPLDTWAAQGFEIRYGPSVQTTWETAIPLTQAAQGTEMTNAAVPPGSWTFFIAGVNQAGQYSQPATSSLTVESVEGLLLQELCAPDFLVGGLGTFTGWFHHYTGVLVPLGTQVMALYVLSPPTPTELVDSFPDIDSITVNWDSEGSLIGSASGGSLGTRTYYVRLTWTDGVGGESLPSVETQMALAADTLLSITSPPPLTGATGYRVYASTASGTETLQAAVAIGTNWNEPTTGLVNGAAMPGSNTTGWRPFKVFCVDPVSQSVYDAPEINNGFVNTFSLFAEIDLYNGPGENGTPDVELWMDYAGANHTYTGTFQRWTGGQITAQYIRPRLIEYPGTDPVVVSDFTPRVNDLAISASGANVSVAADGTVISFAKTFHVPPSVVVTAVGASYLGVAVNITTTGCTLQLYNLSGAIVAGTANWQATGY